MAYAKSNTMDFRDMEVLAGQFTGVFNGTIGGALAGVTTLTDSTGVASPNSTIENVPAAVAASTDTSAASLASTNASLTAIENSLADLAAKVNEIIAALD